MELNNKHIDKKCENAIEIVELVSKEAEEFFFPLKNKLIIYMSTILFPNI